MKISNALGIGIIGASAVLMAGLIYWQQPPETDGTVSAPPPNDARPFHTEEEWTVRQISQFLTDLGRIAQKTSAKPAEVRIRKLPGLDDAGRYEVTDDHEKETISLEPGVWNPATYAAWARKAFPRTPDAAAPPASSLDCAKTLLDPTLATLLAENTRISAFLTAHPASASGHLQAALLVGAVGLNDFSGAFRDLRIPLNRMTAHLAAADALGLPPADSARRLAEAMRLTLCGQQTDALATLPTDASSPLADWSRILRLRNTRDWRSGRAAALAGSPAERHEYFRALARAVDASRGVDFLREAAAKPDVAYGRIADETLLSVENGHIFSQTILNQEFDESIRAAKTFGIPISDKNLDWLKDYLDTPEGSPVTPEGEIQVAGRNLFAGYHQRHLLQGANALFRFLNDQWAVPEEAAGLRGFLTNTLPNLRGKPFLMRMIARSPGTRRTANTPCEAIIRDQPETVTPALWLSLRLDQAGHSVMPGPDFHTWFHPEVPRGTAFETEDRLFQIGVGDENDDQWLKTLWTRAPFSYGLALHSAWLENGRSYDQLSAEIAARWLGPLAEYDLRAMKRLAACYAGQPDLYEQAMTKAAELDPDVYLTMGEYFEQRGLTAKAAAAYLAAFEKANDRVWMANNSLWIVRHLFERGDVAMATRIADDAAKVFSYGGLETAIWLKEQQGRWDQALEIARQLDERYNPDAPTVEVSCLIRWHEMAPAAAEAAGYRDKVLKIFPRGLEKADLANFSSAPTTGVLINGASPAMVPFGLRRNMVIVGLNGYRTDTFEQYMTIRSLSRDPHLRLIVWDGKAYRVSEGQLPDRRFGVDMVTFR